MALLVIYVFDVDDLTVTKHAVYVCASYADASDRVVDPERAVEDLAELNSTSETSS